MNSHHSLICISQITDKDKHSFTQWLTIYNLFCEMPHQASWPFSSWVLFFLFIWKTLYVFWIWVHCGCVYWKYLLVCSSWNGWRTGRPGVLWFMVSQRVGHNWVTELNWTDVLACTFHLLKNVLSFCYYNPIEQGF